MSYANSLFGNNGYVELNAGETLTGSFQGVKTRGADSCVLTIENKQGDDSLDLTLKPAEMHISPCDRVVVTSGSAFVFLAAPNFFFLAALKWVDSSAWNDATNWDE